MMQFSFNELLMVHGFERISVSYSDDKVMIVVDNFEERKVK